jgi:ABC-2 type transport system permease protein
MLISTLFIKEEIEMRKKFRQILGMATLSGKWIQRQPLWLFQGFIFTLGFAVTLFAWGRNLALKNLVVAYFITGSWGLGLNIIAQGIGWDRVYYFYDFYVASPLSLPMYFIGNVLGTLPFLLINLVPAMLIAMLIGMDISFLPLLLLLSIVSVMIGAFLSLSVILRLKNPTNISAITNPMHTFTTILPPIYYPLSLFPSMWREVALVMPTVSLMELGRVAAHIPTGCNPSLSFISLLLWLILSAVLVIKKLKWGLE